MSEGRLLAASVQLAWERGDQDFLAGRYSRAHTLRFDGGAVIAASSAPAVVAPPWSDAAAVDPEEMFVAALSSCHMLWFLDFARRIAAEVQSYSDHAEGVLARDAEGRTWVTRVVLRPAVVFGDPIVPARLVETLHHQAHQACFIANSVKTEIVVEPVQACSG